MKKTSIPKKQKSSSKKLSLNTMKKGDKVTYINAFGNSYKGTIVGFELKKVPYRKNKVKYVKILSDNTHEIIAYLSERIKL